MHMLYRLTWSNSSFKIQYHLTKYGLLASTLLSNAVKYGKALQGPSTSIADIYIYTKPQIEYDYLPHANAFGNNDI